MYNVSDTYLTKIVEPSRQLKTRIYFNDSEIPLEENIISVSVTEMGMSSETLTIGDLCTNQAKVQFYMPNDSICLEGGKFKVEQGLYVGVNDLEENDIQDGYEYVSLGTFYVDSIDKKDTSSIVTIIGYDCTTRLNKDYVAGIDYPATIEHVIEDICEQCHISFMDYDFPDMIIDTYYETTCQEMLSFMASLLGKNIKANRDDAIEFYWWKSNQKIITKDIQYIDQLTKKSDDNIVINSLTSGSEDNVIVSGKGKGITFTNPYMTQEILDQLFIEIQGFSYTPLSIQYRGNPAFEIGDIILVEDNKGEILSLLLSEHEMILTGMNGKIDCVGKIADETVVKMSPTDKKLKKLYNSLETSFKNTSETIIGAKGGYFVIDRNEQGLPIGFKIMDTPTLTENTNLWIFNQKGFGFSNDGGKTLENVAIDMNGNINANAIHTGIIQGNCFDIDLESGTIIMGKRNDDGTFASEWFRVDENGIFMSVSEKTQEEIKNVNDSIEELTQKQNELHQYFRYGTDGIEIGTDSSLVKMRLTNEKLSFLQDSTEIAYMSQNKLYITEGLFMQRCTIGDKDNFYEWVIRQNGNMSLKYRGGSYNGN